MTQATTTAELKIQLLYGILYTTSRPNTNTLTACDIPRIKVDITDRLLDVLKPLSGCRQESVEKMERRILEFRICIGFRLAVPPLPHTWYCFPGMSLQRVFVLWVFVCSVNLSLFAGYHAEGYNVRTDTFKLTGYHVCRVTTPELPRSIETSEYRRVITPAGSF